MPVLTGLGLHDTMPRVGHVVAQRLQVHAAMGTDQAVFC
jgi:hypothetical protein